MLIQRKKNVIIINNITEIFLNKSHLCVFCFLCASSASAKQFSTQENISYCKSCYFSFPTSKSRFKYNMPTQKNLLNVTPDPWLTQAQRENLKGSPFCSLSLKSHHYSHGKNFTVRTDHKALKGIFAKDLEEIEMLHFVDNVNILQVTISSFCH